jgi:hypothetical protein
MDKSEKLVAAFLAHQGYSDIENHPDGKHCPPDFLVDRRIAVEVRRLNQNYQGKTRIEGLEEEAIRLRDRIRKCASSFGRPTQGVSWFLFFDFRRPVDPWKKLKPKLRDALQGFMNDTAHTQTHLSLGNGFELKFFPASNLHSTFYVLGMLHDNDSGAWVIAELEKNLRICIREKTDKIAKYKPKYPEWWLVLVDRIGYGLDQSDRKQFRDTVSLYHEWDRIVLLDPLDHSHAFEVTPDF